MSQVNDTPVTRKKQANNPTDRQGTKTTDYIPLESLRKMTEVELLHAALYIQRMKEPSLSAVTRLVQVGGLKNEEEIYKAIAAPPSKGIGGEAWLKVQRHLGFNLYLDWVTARTIMGEKQSG